MYECATLGVGWHISSRDVLEAFDDSLSHRISEGLCRLRGINYSLAASIVPDNHGQWMEELDHIDVPAVKGTKQDMISK